MEDEMVRMNGLDLVRIASYNIKHADGGSDNVRCNDNDWWLVGCERIAAVIETISPDIIGLQEVDRFWSRSGNLDQVQWFTQRLGMYSSFAPNVIHPPDSHSDLLHEYGTMILSKFPILWHRHTTLPFAVGWESRGLLEAAIELPNGTCLHVANTHLQTSTVSGNHEEAQRQRIEQIAAIAGRLQAATAPVVLVGDFNACPTSVEIDLLRSEIGLRDAWSVVGAGPGYTFCELLGTKPSRRIDYIFVSAEISLVTVNIADNHLSSMASDHLPIVVDVGV